MPPLVEKRAEKLNLQDCFNIAWKWSDNHDLCFERGTCVYRNVNNTNACLLGACIPDEFVNSDMFGTIGQLAAGCNWFYDIFDSEINLLKLRGLQRCHDDLYFLEDKKEYQVKVKDNLRVFASINNLSIPE